MSKSCWLAATGLALLSLSLSSQARAFHDPTRFGAGVLEAGGGGRYFTGSPADGFACTVCHGPGPEVRFRLLGVPSAGYVPGQTYYITVDWLEFLEHVAFNAEVTNSVGRTIGTLAVPPAEALLPDDLCKEPSIPAAQVGAIADGRMVVISPACQQQQGTFAWTAPPAGSGAVFLSGSLVVSNADGEALGDRAVAFSRVIPQLGSESPDAVHVEGLVKNCAVVAVGHPTRSMGWAGILPLLLTRLWRRRSSVRLK